MAERGKFLGLKTIQKLFDVSMQSSIAKEAIQTLNSARNWLGLMFGSLRYMAQNTCRALKCGAGVE